MKLRTIAICLFFFTTSAFAQSLPLQGYYRPGQYMPVKIGAGETTITASHAVPTLASAASTDRIVPFLLLDESATQLQINNQRLPLQPLRDTQRLIGFIDTDLSTASALFATDEAIPVRLAFVDLRNAIPLSVDALDALVLSFEQFRQLGPKVNILLDCGISIAVRSTLAPDSVHPWQRKGDLYVTHRAPSPRFNGTPREAAYDPISSWRPQRSAEARWLIVAVAAFFCVVFLAMSVLPRKWPVIASIVIGGLAITAIVLLSRHPQMRRWSTASPYHDHVARYFASADDQHFEEILPVPGYPVPFSIQHASDLNLQLHISANNIIVAFDLDADRRMCILSASP